MKIFITWSGPRSKAIAEAVKTWIKAVLQATQPWISTRDIPRGTPWREHLRKELSDTDTGILCITNANKTAPWILFEAGAIAKLEKGIACTLLIDLKPSDVKDPLAQFQHTDTSKESLRQLLKEINSRLSETSRLDDETFNASFDAHWPMFESKIEAAKKIPEDTQAPPPRSTDDMIREVLEKIRLLDKKITTNQPDPIREAIAAQRARMSPRGLHPFNQLRLFDNEQALNAYVLGMLRSNPDLLLKLINESKPASDNGSDEAPADPTQTQSP